MAYDWVIRGGNVLLGSGQAAVRWDVAIENGKIVAMGPEITTEADRVIEAGGCLVSPPFVESHIHLDSVLVARDSRANGSGTLFEGIEIWGERKKSLTLEDVKDRAIQALKLQASLGVGYVRTHADVSEGSLTALQALLEVRDAVKTWMVVQVVAFPQDGVYGSAANEGLLEESLRRGADAVGGIPHYELTREDGVRSVQRIFDLAERYDKLIDIHCDEVDDEQSRFLEVMVAEAGRRGMGDRTTASHTTAFGSYSESYATKLMGNIRRFPINFVANPLINITLQGRSDRYPKRRGMTRVKELWNAGLNVSFGHDCIQDPWYPLGTGNMLDVAMMGLHVGQMTGVREIDACYDMVTFGGARTLGLGDYGLSVGGKANLMVLGGENRYEVLRGRSPVLHSFCRGRRVVERSPEVVCTFLPG